MRPASSHRRRPPLSVAALACVLASACGGGAASGEPPPNLLIVLLDTTRADHLSCYGYGRETTPAVDALARGGVRFEEVYAPSSLTPVSAGTILSGTWPFRHGVRSLFVVGEVELAADVPSLPEMLAASGRRTAAFVSARPMGAHYGLARGFETYDDDLSETAARHGIERFADAPQRPADETVERALEWIGRHGGEPFALLVHLFDTHDISFLPPREFLERHVSFPLPEGLGRLADARRFPELYRPERLVELYDAELRFMDEQLARLLAGLEEEGALERTLVAVLADHGEAFGEHGFWTHGLLYEEQLRVPLVLKGPGLAAGTLVEGRARLVDLPPTLAELLELPDPRHGFDGTSLVPRIRGRPGGADLPVYAEVHHAEEDRLRREPEMYALALGRWKYVHRPRSGEHELYDLEADPGELTNLYAPDHPMARALAASLSSLGAVSGSVPSLEGIPEEELRRLRELGYL